ncbi:cell division protein FtsK [Campylobacter novaezeelandiae]|uniref:Cell division protein FtsK n=1 Tax=Campylobacter novaezeelandiae TaxID=2267891 RepID=A0A4Q9JW17_9BACT|nr:DNA translocase FtsK [Campylobacter novaezeelandiae]TBR81532.1 cell division protein FtsK [Campylobacter novaezeelandiae]TBR82275.1 cell division protein FtsK [Campylobacter novaezeelandiae]
MFIPSMGNFLYKFNILLFGKFGYFYPFFLMIINYIYYKRHYRLENFKRSEIFGFCFIIFSAMLLFAIFYPNEGYILKLLYKSFSFFFGHILSGLIALFFLLLSIVLLFPGFIKEVFNLELDFSKFLYFESKIKALFMDVFGGEKEEVENKNSKTPIFKFNLKQTLNSSNEIKNNLTETKQKQESENLIKSDITEEKINKEEIKEEEKNINENINESKSFIYETSKEIENFAKKASRSSISLDEELNFILQEEADMIPERFLKPKKIEDLKDQIDEKSNLDEPSYKRKNIEISLQKTTNKPKIFEKELELREQLLQKAKLAEEYKVYQNQILENRVKEEIQILEKEENLNILQGNKYTINDQYNDKEITPAEEKQEFLPTVEELNTPYIPQTPVIKMSEIKEEPFVSQQQNLLENETNQNLKENLDNEILSQDDNLQDINLNESKQKNELSRGILVKEIELNQQLLKDIEQGEIQKPNDFKLPSLEFLANPVYLKQDMDENEIDKKIYDLLEKLRRFKIGGDVISTSVGPVVTTFEFRPSADVKVSRILNLQDDLAMALKAKSIRIQAPIPGKDVVGIEVPNEQIQTIYLREILESDVFQNAKSSLAIALGKDIAGNAFITDLKKLPHLLIAGTTGSGKSVGINSMLLSLLYRNSPKTLRLLMIDPKMLEFSIYNEIPHLLTPVITDPKKAIIALSNMVAEMERRYRLMADAKTKNIENYNEKMKEKGLETLPFIVVIIDELADLMMTAGKDVEFYIGRLAQMARASGIHLIVATQRPSVDVVTGLIKANLPSRISYKVGQKIDSKVILDAMGAESLLGRGDCLFTPPGTSSIVRLHAPFASESEIEKIVDFLKDQESVEYDENFLKDSQGANNNAQDFDNDEFDELFEDAKRVILEDRKTSISYLQRRLKIGYNRAANIIEQLSKAGILSEPDSKGQREIII